MQWKGSNQKDWNENKAKKQGLQQERKWDGCREKTCPHVFIPYLFRATARKHLTPDEKTKAIAIAVNFNDLGLTLKDIPRFEAAGVSLVNEHTHVHIHTCICRIWSLAHSPFRVAFFLQYGPNSHSLVQVRMNCWERDKMGCNAETDSQWKLRVLRNYGQILLLTWQKWDDLLADTSENTAPVRKV